MITITSKDNHNIKEYIKLSSQRKYRDRCALFVLEGARLCTDAIKNGVSPKSMFFTESSLDKYRTLASEAESLGAEVFIISDSLGERLSGTGSTQGVFAVCRTLDKLNLIDTIYSGGRFLVLNNLQDPGNVGTIIRTAEAVGVAGVVLVNCCDAYSPKVVRSTMGSLFRVPLIFEDDIFSVIDAFDKKSIPVYAAVVDSDAASLTECDFSDGAAVIIGNEGSGLPREVSAACRRLTIRMRGNTESLNAAMAAGIILWEMTK